MDEQLTLTEHIEKKARDTARSIERTHHNKGEICAVCGKTIHKEDIAAGRYVYTQSSASGTSYICTKCAGM